jgi:hypothetical protein
LWRGGRGCGVRERREDEEDRCGDPRDTGRIRLHRLLLRSL